jgi:hypothetical protein
MLELKELLSALKSLSADVFFWGFLIIELVRFGWFLLSH